MIQIHLILKKHLSYLRIIEEKNVILIDKYLYN